MADLVCTHAKGRVAALASYPNSPNDRIVLALFMAEGLPSDNFIRNAVSIEDVTGFAQEHPEGRRMLAPEDVTVTFDTSTSRASVTITPQTYTALAASDPLGALLVCYSPTDTSQDSQLQVLTKHDLSVTPDGSDLTITPAAAGLYQAV